MQVNIDVDLLLATLKGETETTIAAQLLDAGLTMEHVAKLVEQSMLDEESLRQATAEQLVQCAQFTLGDALKLKRAFPSETEAAQ